MKNLNDLMTLITKCLEQNGEHERNHWFIDFSGHVNQLSIRRWKHGWEMGRTSEDCIVRLTEDGIQEAYWFLANRIK